MSIAVYIGEKIFHIHQSEVSVIPSDFSNQVISKLQLLKVKKKGVLTICSKETEL